MKTGMLPGRTYIRVLNLRYLKGSRDFAAYLKSERRGLLEDAKEARTEEEVALDTTKAVEIKTAVETANSKVLQLSYVRDSTGTINTQLSELSVHNEEDKIVFDVLGGDIEDISQSLKLVSIVNDKKVVVGGDGRVNQIFFATWAARNRLHESSPLEVTFVCVEEPEAHLHPHQQRKLASYLASKFPTQVIITSHSPQIACEFAPDSIIRLHRQAYNAGSVAASDGCSPEVTAYFKNFGFRLTVVPAEAFFAKVALLVEGPSEVIFYQALAGKIGIDLDRLNISIVPVAGVGFELFMKLLVTCLGISVVVRTDCDFFKVPKKDRRRAAGVQRCFQLLLSQKKLTGEIALFHSTYSSSLEWDLVDESTEPPAKTMDAVTKSRIALREFNLFLSSQDLERDLLNTVLAESITDFFDCEASKTLDYMQEAKATFMYEFVQERGNTLSGLRDDDICLPLLKCAELALN